MATIVGLFDHQDRAQGAIEELRSGGIPSDNISIVMRSPEETNAVATESGVAGGAVTGAIGGGVLGGLAGLLVGIGLLVIPGIGPVVAGGWLATTLVGAGIGAATGGLVGALVEAGVPEEEARRYESGVERGGVLVAVRAPEGREDYVRTILSNNGARDVNSDYANFYGNPDFAYGTGQTSTATDTTYQPTATGMAAGSTYNPTDTGYDAAATTPT